MRHPLEIVQVVVIDGLGRAGRGHAAHAPLQGAARGFAVALAAGLPFVRLSLPLVLPVLVPLLVVLVLPPCCLVIFPAPSTK